MVERGGTPAPPQRRPPVSIDLETACIERFDNGIPNEEEHFPATTTTRGLDDIYSSRIHCAHEQAHAYDAIAITHTDADGLACAALYQYQFENPLILFATHSESKRAIKPLRGVRRGFENAPAGADFPPVYISDLGPDSEACDEWIDEIEQIPSPVFFRDHHNTDPGPLADHVTDYVHITEDKCAADLVRANDIDDPPEHLDELVAATAIRDLWQEDHPQFYEYELLTVAADTLGPADYVQRVRDHGLRVITPQGIRRELEYRNYVRHRKADWVVDNMSITTNVGGHRVAVAYGDGDGSVTGNQLRDHHNADLGILIRPYGIVHFRSSDEFPVCAAIAERFGGGGHVVASAAKVDFNDLAISAEDHVDTRGELVRQRVIEQLRNLVREGDY